MLFKIPIKARDKYIEMCHEIEKAKNQEEYNLSKNKALGYSDAIRDICGSGVWGCITREADMSFEKDIPCCCGIPIKTFE